MKTEPYNQEEHEVQETSSQDETLNETHSNEEPSSPKKKKWLRTLVLSCVLVFAVGFAGSVVTGWMTSSQDSSISGVQTETQLVASMERIQGYARALDALEHAYVEDNSLASTTSWKMDYQDNVQWIRQETSTLEKVGAQSKESQLKPYITSFKTIADGYDMRYTGIQEQDMELIQKGSELISKGKSLTN